jgi:iron complex transport system substrate-binding protein
MAAESKPAPLFSASEPAGFPRRIVCLTDETTETLYLLGEQDRIAGISAYASRPPEARSKPRVSAFRDANFEKILALEPDLVLAFSDVQAEISRELIRRGQTVLHFNQRSVAQIFEMMGTLARLVGKERAGEALIASLKSGLDAIADAAQKFPRRPRVYFEEWDEPLISGIEWVEELIEIAGGEPVFPELRHRGKAQDRVVDPAEVIQRGPEVILASWCGKKVKKDAIAARLGWAAISAVRNGHIYEIEGDSILQPGPASLTDGVRQIHAILARVARIGTAEDSAPAPCKIEPGEL